MILKFEKKHFLLPFWVIFLVSIHIYIIMIGVSVAFSESLNHGNNTINYDKAALEDIHGAETFPTEPSQFAPVRTVFGLHGVALVIPDYRRENFEVPITSHLPVDCRGISDVRCHSASTYCSDLYGSSLGSHSQELPLYPISKLAVYQQPDDHAFWAINANFLSTKSRVTGKRQDGNVYYEQPCSVPLGILISHGHIISDAYAVEGTEKNGGPVGFDVLAFWHSTLQKTENIEVIRNFQNSNATEKPPSAKSLVDKGVYTAISGFIVGEDGKPFLQGCTKQRRDKCLGIPILSQYPAARTVIGIGNIDNRNPYQVVVAVFQPGRQDARKTGLYPWEAADYLMEHYRSKTVFMLDGGGSSQFVTNTVPSGTAINTSIIPCDRNHGNIWCSLPGDLDRKTGKERWRPVTTALTISP